MFRSFRHRVSTGAVLATLAGWASGVVADGPDRAVIGPTAAPDGSLVAIVRWPGPIGIADAAAWIESTGGISASIADGPANGTLRCLRADPWLELDACDGPWIGLARAAAGEPGVEPWRWSDSSPSTFVAWAEGRPAGSHRFPGHAVMDDAGRWFDVLPGPDAGVTVRSAAVRWPSSADGDGDGIPDPIARDGIDSILGAPGCAPDPADLDGNGRIDASDLAILLASWGTIGPGDVDGNGIVDATDLAEVLARWS